MSKKPLQTTPSLADSKLVPPEIVEILGAPALVGCESAEVFYRMMSRFVVEFSPQTVTEWLLVWDLVNVNWEIARYRRMKASFIRAESPAAADRLLRDDDKRGIFRLKAFSPPVPADKTGRSGAKELLASSGISLDDVAGAAAFYMVKKLTQIEDLIERLELRRERQFKELQAHRVFSLSSSTASADKIIEEAVVIEQ